MILDILTLPTNEGRRDENKKWSKLVGGGGGEGVTFRGASKDAELANLHFLRSWSTFLCCRVGTFYFHLCAVPMFHSKNTIIKIINKTNN